MPSQLTLEEVADGSQIAALAASKLTGALPAIDGSNLTGLVSTFSAQTDATVSTIDPTQSENPSVDGHIWVNKTAGTVFVCTDNTAGSNVWTPVGPPAPTTFSFYKAEGVSDTITITSGTFPFYKADGSADNIGVS